MPHLTLEDIISSISIERTTSKDSCKTQATSINHETYNFKPQSQYNHTTSTQLTLISRQQNNHQSNPNRRSCKRLTKPRKPQQKWTSQEQQQLCDLIGRYGSDFTFLEEYFPERTRKQLKRKYQEVNKNKFYMRKIQKIEESIVRERRKSVFDEEIMENQLNKQF